jgi:hypothetical protein
MDEHGILCAKHTNKRCRKCKSTNRNMITVGTMDFCNPCFKEEFEADEPQMNFGAGVISSESETYKRWLKAKK